jgi:hypothetical protein
MEKLPLWILQFLFYGTLAALFIAANAGDPYSTQAFPVIVCLRAASCIIVAWNIDSSWYEPRSILESSIRFGGEALIVIGLVATEHNVVAVLSVLTLALYEFARVRITPRLY